MAPVNFMVLVKFRDIPTGGRIDYCNKIWVVLENYDDGLIIEYTGEKSLWHSHCCFVDSESSTTLDTEVNFIG